MPSRRARPPRSNTWARTSRICITVSCVAERSSRIASRRSNWAFRSSGVAGLVGLGVTSNAATSDRPTAVSRTLTSEKKKLSGDLEERSREQELLKGLDKPLEIKEGLNRVVWDVRVFKPALVPKAVFNEGEKAPPKVAPGTYHVRLTAVGRSLVAAFEVTPNPTSPATPEDLKAQFDLLEAIRDDLSATHETVMQIRDVRAQVLDLGGRARRLGMGEALEKRAVPLARELTALELELTNPQIKADEDDLNYEPKLDHDFTYLAGIVASADRRPTAGSLEVYRELKGKLDAARGRFQALLAGEVAGFSRAAGEMKLPRIAPAPRLGS